MQESASAPNLAGAGDEDGRARVGSDLASVYPSLYGVPSFSSVFADPIDFEPGPGQYDVPASIGPQ